MTALLTIFAAGFLSVFVLGFQSRAVNHGNYRWAAAGAFAIGLSQTLLWGALLRNLTLAGAVTYGASGAFAIVVAMKLHQRLLGPRA